MKFSHLLTTLLAAAVTSSAGASDAPTLNLGDMPDSFLWHVRSITIKCHDNDPDLLHYKSAKFPYKWRYNYERDGNPPGGRIIMFQADVLGDEQLEYGLLHTLEEQPRHWFIYDSNMQYCTTLPYQQVHQVAQKKKQVITEYLTTLHELLSTDSPRWLTEVEHEGYRDNTEKGIEYSRYLTPHEALTKLNEHLGIKNAPTDTEIPAPLFPTRLKHYNDITKPKSIEIITIDIPEGELPLPTLKSAPTALLQHLLNSEFRFGFGEQYSLEPELTGETIGGELQVKLHDLFGGPEPEYLLHYHAPLCYGEEAPSHPVTFIFDHKGNYCYTINNDLHAWVGLFHPIWAAVRKDDYTSAEDSWEGDMHFRGARIGGLHRIWRQLELHEDYARLVIWDSFDSWDEKEPEKHSTPPRQTELICTKEGNYLSQSLCSIGRPSHFRYMNFALVLQRMCDSDMRHPEVPHLYSPCIRTSLHEFLTSDKPRWVQDTLADDMKSAADAYTQEEALRVLKEELQRRGIQPQQ